MTTAQVQARNEVRTRPLSDERIQNLMKWKTVGEFTKLTNGGDAMNGTDALIAREMVRREDEIEYLTKKRKNGIKLNVRWILLIK